jgi:hypothetical protein
MTVDPDGGSLSDRFPLATAVAAVAAGLLVVLALDGAAIGDECCSERVFAPFIVVGACYAFARRARTDRDPDAYRGAAVVAVATVLAWVAAAAATVFLPRVLSSSTSLEGPVNARWSDQRGALGLLARVLIGLVGLLMPALFGARLIRLPWHGQLRPPRPAMAPIVLACLAGALLFPVLAATQAYVLHFAHRLARIDEHAPALRDVLRGRLPQGRGLDAVLGTGLLPIGASLSLLLPGLELLLHGTARRAFAGAATLPFVAMTAVAASFIMPTLLPAPILWAGFLVTGVFARRTESVVPGIVFWQALALGEFLWHAVVP